MKRNAILRIVIYSLLILLLSSVLVVGVLGSFDLPTFISGGLSLSNGLPNSTKAPQATFDPSEIDEIFIIWISGNVTVSAEERTDIAYQTLRKGSDLDTAYRLENGRLTIGFTQKSFVSGKVKEKDLVLSIPNTWNGKVLEIEAVSTDIEISNLANLSKLDIENVSGEINVRNSTFTEVEIETVSGGIYLAGTFSQIDVEAISAKCTIDAVECPKTIDIETVSGETFLSLPQGYGFELSIDGIGKTVHTTLPYQKDGDRYISNGELGNCIIDVDSVSGSVTISPRQ